MWRYFKPSYYVSLIDQFLKNFNETHPLSLSQRKEKQKFERLAALRDNAQKSSK